MLLGLDKMFAPKEVRKISVEDSTHITLLKNDMREMEERHRTEMEAFARAGYLRMSPSPIYDSYFDGEKTGNGIGPAMSYQPWYDMLRARSWAAYLDSEVAQLVINKFILWIVGDGLKLQAEPEMDVLKSEGYYDVDEAAFEKLAEARYNLYTGSAYSDYADMLALDELVAEMEKNALIGGDVLVIQRYVSGQAKVQLIDGVHVQNPLGVPQIEFNELDRSFRDTADGNRISYGIKLDKKGQHLGYYVQTGLTDYEYVPARDPANGQVRAFLYYGLRYRVDNVRGLPLIAAVLEKLKRLERYEEATLSGAEERAKVPYFFEHDLGSSGEHPLTGRLATASGISPKGDMPKDINGENIRKLVAATMDKDVFNMPPGAKVKAMESDIANEFTPFLTTNINLVASTCGIPPDVAMSMYNSNYSASRAAIKDWEHIVLVKRARLSRNFYQHNYNFWLDIEVLNNRINLPGYLKAKIAGNVVALAAFRKARWIGAQVPHIDPVREAQAARIKLGPLGANIPLIGADEAAELTNGSEVFTNITRLANVLKKMEEAGLKLLPEEKGKEKEEEDDEENKEK